MVKMISSTLLQNFLNFEHNPTDATFTLNTVIKLRSETAKLSTRRKGLIQDSAQTPNLVFSNSALACILSF